WDLTGALVLAPALVVASTAPPRRWTTRRGAEAAALLVVLVVVGDLVFGGVSNAGGGAAPLHFLCIPVVLYVALRFGQLETAVATVLLSLIAIAGTLRGLGPFRSQGPNESLLVLQAFLAVLSVTGLVVAAVNGAAEAANRMKSEFLGLVAHELRTPLTALQLQMERLRRDPAAQPNARQAQILAAMSLSERRLADLIEGLLQYMRVERGGYQLATERVAVETLVSEALDEMRLQAERKGLTLSFESSKLPPLVTDPSLLRLVVTNLVGNAIKFTSAGGIEVRLGHRDGAHRIAVADTGPGIARADQRRVFEPFEQVSPMTKKHLPGFGLGLALARDVTAALGGRIELASAPGAGSTFTVVIPGKQAPAPAA
ncbi:MAG TPA: ATP-binding protein, partial [Thermoanaerobaculia bacterium]|nr:ATP-binding protein [Thermoanaerobaculia bacterium]